MILILGAGLAGLSAAYHLKDDYEIYEMKMKVGGVASSETCNGFVFDHGIHVLHTQNDEVLRLLDRVLGNNIHVQTRRAWIFSHGVYTKYPFQANTYGLPIPIVKECVVEFAKAKYERKSGMANNYAEWVHNTFGRGIAKHFMIPYSKKMWIVNPEELSTDWMSPRFPQPTIGDVVEGALHFQEKEFGPNAQFRYPIHGGIQTISTALASKVKRISFGKEAEKLIPREKKIVFADGEKINYNKLISTVPLPELIKMIGDEAPGTVRKAAENLKCVSDIVVNLGIDNESLPNYHWVYFPEKEYPFLRISFPKNLSTHTVPKDKSSVSAEVFYLENMRLKREEITPKVANSLIKAGIMQSDDEIIHESVFDIKYAYVLYTHDRKSNTRIIHNFLRKHHIYPIGRFGEWKYFWMDDAILSGKRIADELIE